MGSGRDELSTDARRLLYTITAYTGLGRAVAASAAQAGEALGRPWLKEFVVGAIVCHGAGRGVFAEYDPAPSLYSFRGVKTFAMLSQGALEDLDRFFTLGLVEKLLLNTRYYTTITAVRSTPEGTRLARDPDFLGEGDRKSVESLIRCPKCGKLFDFAVFKESADAPRGRGAVSPVVSAGGTCGGIRLVMARVCACMTRGAHATGDTWHVSCPAAYDRIDSFFSIGDVSYKGRAFFLGA